jgi:hypothetical protein
MKKTVKGSEPFLGVLLSIYFGGLAVSIAVLLYISAR